MAHLTIGMATYNDFDGLYFTLQALRMYHDLRDVEYVVVDNYGCDATRDFVRSLRNARYVLATEAVGTAAPRNRVFAEASGEIVLCCDSHVEFVPGAIAALLAWFAAFPESRDLIQGPLLYDDLHTISTHFDPVWSDQMWGTWGTDPRGLNPAAPAFDIPSQGLGIFACRRDAWLGFNPMFRGFGGEEGYIHEKFRQAGARTLCLPALRWIHRFGRPYGVPYPLRTRDKFRNYLIGHSELGLPLQPIVEHFDTHLSPPVLKEVMREILGVDALPPAAPEELISPLPPEPVRPVTPPDLTPVPGLPLVSCICATYNRAPGHIHLLEEAIFSFLQQDYPNKELIVVNDAPGQELVCDAPGVRIINAPNRLPSLGAKHNLAISAAHGDLIAVWDDDDISLPWRLSLSVERLGDADYFNPGVYWFKSAENPPKCTHDMGYAHNASLFRRAAWERTGGYTAVPVGVDEAMDGLLRRHGTVAPPLEGMADLERWFYVYRRGVSPAHLSISTGDRGRFAEIGRQHIAAGRFTLTPRWRRDYLAETRDVIAARPPSEAAPPAPASIAPLPATTTIAPLPVASSIAVPEVPPVETELVLPYGRVPRPLPHRAIFFHPARPDGSHILAALMERHGWTYAASPNDADWCVLYLDETTVTLPPDDPFAAASWGWINGRCRDISKTTVDRIFGEVFGYHAAIDPLTYVGPCVKKADENYRKGRQAMLTCPLAPDQLEPGMVYQRFVDSHLPEIGYPEDHADIIGGRVVLVRRTVRPETLPPEKFFLDPRDESLTFADSIFTIAEQEQIARFCAAFGCDVAKMDIIRDVSDGRIYILDVAKTPGGSHPETIPEQIRWEQRMDLWAQALIDAYPSQRRVSPPEPPPAPGQRAGTPAGPTPATVPPASQPIPAVTVFSYPSLPDPSHMLGWIASLHGWRFTDDPAAADLRLLYRDDTVTSLPADDPHAESSWSWLNGRGRDISKSRVERLFAEVFGYPLAVDPRTHRGPLLRKSDANYAKDAAILQGPLPETEIDPRSVYERLVDGRVAGEGVVELNTYVVGDEIAACFRQVRPDWITAGQFSNRRLRLDAVEPDSVFTPEEQARVVALSRAMGLDVAKLDLMRDAADGRLYCYDVNKTIGGWPPDQEPSADFRVVAERIARSLARQFLAPRAAADPAGATASPVALAEMPVFRTETPAIFFYPNPPHPSHLFSELIARFGWTSASDLASADYAVLYRDDTVTTLAADDPYAADSQTWVNGRFRDISKRRVQQVFETVFGYPLALDPLTHEGALLRKSNANFVKDAIILQGPLAPETLDPRFVYERLVDSRIPHYGFEELIPYVVGNRIASVIRKIRGDWIATGAFTMDSVDHQLVPADAVFTAEEQARIIAFAHAMGADISKIDVLRDRADGRIVIIDIAKTVGGQPRAVWNGLNLDCWLVQMRDAVLADLPSPRPPLPEPPPIPALTLFAHPDRPESHHLLGMIADAFGWRFTDDPAVADVRVLFRDRTTVALAAADPLAGESATWLNGRCHDISKARVERVFAETFGYPLAVDPRTHHGPLLRKSNANYVKDATILQGPLPDAEIGRKFVYERLVDGRIDGLGIVELTVYVVGDEIPACYRTIRPDWIAEGRYRTDIIDLVAVEPDSILSAEEQARLIAFCRAMGLDLAKLDVTRDRTDGRIYCYDANKTPGGWPPNGPYRLSGDMVLDRVARSIARQFAPGATAEIAPS